MNSKASNITSSSANFCKYSCNSSLHSSINPNTYMDNTQTHHYQHFHAPPTLISLHCSLLAVRLPKTLFLGLTWRCEYSATVKESQRSSATTSLNLRVTLQAHLRSRPRTTKQGCARLPGQIGRAA